MATEIAEIGPAALGRYGTVPIAFVVRSILQPIVVDGGLGGITLHEELVPMPYTKDYDTYGEGRPQDWPKEFDVDNWGFFLATDGGNPIGGATVAYDTPAVYMLVQRRDLGVLWDIRVHPDRRGEGIGKALFWRAAEWCRGRGCTQMKIETQNVNVPACRFYHSQGARLGEINRYAYTGHPDVGHEVMLVWYLDLTHHDQPGNQPYPTTEDTNDT